MNYIEKLKSFEQVVHAMKLDAPLSSWNSLYVDYHPPIVERLWRTFVVEGVKHRVYLHRIHPCGEAEPLMHPHPWPSAVKILEGEQEIIDRSGDTMILTPGCYYEMTNRDAQHSVNPLGSPSLSLMISGAPYPGFLAPKPYGKLRPLTDKEIEALVEDVLRCAWRIKT